MSPDNAKAIANSTRHHTSDESDTDRSSPASARKQLRPRKMTQISSLVVDLHGSPSSNKKPRGRPPGSKNKPKPPILITSDVVSESAMKPVVLEIADGTDVIEVVAEFARRRRVGITLLSGSGSVSNVTLQHPLSHAPNSLISLHGPFHLLSIWGSYMAFDVDVCGGNAPDPYCGGEDGSSFGITLSGVQGQVFGGVVGGKVVAAGQVTLVAATYVNPRFHSLPEGPEEEDDETEAAFADGGGTECLMAAEQVMPWSGGGGSTSNTSTCRPPPQNKIEPY